MKSTKGYRAVEVPSSEEQTNVVILKALNALMKHALHPHHPHTREVHDIRAEVVTELQRLEQRATDERKIFDRHIEICSFISRVPHTL